MALAGYIPLHRLRRLTAICRDFNAVKVFAASQNLGTLAGCNLITPPPLSHKFRQFLPTILGVLVLTSLGYAQGRHTKGEKPLSIAQGQKVELADFLVTGKTTIFEFTSEYCPPCRAYAEPLLALHQRGTNLAVVKVDINRPEYHEIDWDSPVALQYALSDKGLPYFKIFGPDGKLMVEGPDARQQVNEWVGQLQR